MSSSDVSDDADIRVICGPTGAGKSALAIRLIEQAAVGPCTIISADSRQIYRGFDIGTAKPSVDERTRIPHLGVDVASPHERYSAARWASAAREWIDDARQAGRTPVVVGGTGLYLRALFDGLFVEPVLDSERRGRLAAHLAPQSTEALRGWVSAVDPARALLGRTQLLRAIEIATLTGRRISDLHRESTGEAPLRARMLVVDPGPVLAAWNEARLDRMFREGWLDEVRALILDVDADAPAWNASGYGVMRRLASGDLDLSSARDAIVIETRQYAKRQRTWFRHQLGAHPVTRVDPTSVDVARVAAAWWLGDIPSVA